MKYSLPSYQKFESRYEMKKALQSVHQEMSQPGQATTTRGSTGKYATKADRGGGFDVPQDAEDRMNTVVDLLQAKYEENLQVINAIYNEKKEMELKMRAMEARLRASEGDRSFRPEEQQSMSKQQRGGSSFSQQPQPPQSLPRSNSRGSNIRSNLMVPSGGDQDVPDDVMDSTATNRNNNSQVPVFTNTRNDRYAEPRLSAADAAAIFDRETAKYTGTSNVTYNNTSNNNNYNEDEYELIQGVGVVPTRNRLTPRPRSASTTPRSRNGRSSPLFDSYYHGPNSNNNSTSQLHQQQRRQRSHSAGSTGRTHSYGHGISAELRKSQNKFVQSVMLSRYEAEQARLKQVQHEKYLKERLARAAKHGEFKRLARNEAEFQAKRRQQLEIKLKALKEAEEKEIEAHRKQIQEHISKPRDAMYAGLTWQQLEDKLNMERAARKQQFKEKLEAELKPFGLHKSIKTARLQQEAEISEAQANQQRVIVSAKTFNSELNKRDEECQKRRMARLERQQKKEQEELTAKIEEERKRKERVDNMKMPPSSRRLTKAAEKRTETVREQLKREKEAKEAEAKALEERQKREREHAAVIKSMIKLNDEDRKAKTNFVELSVALTKAEEGKRSYQESLRNNKKALKEKLQSRPTLMQRHDKEIAINAATNNAIAKVGSVAASVSRSASASRTAAGGASSGKSRGDGSKYAKGKDDYDDDDDFLDILDEKEKMVAKAINK